MRHVGRAKRLAAASALLLVLGACSDGSDEPGNDPTATPTTTSPTPTATETPPTQPKLHHKLRKPRSAKYYDVRDQLRQDPSTPLRVLRSVAISMRARRPAAASSRTSEARPRPDRRDPHRRARWCSRSTSTTPTPRPAECRPSRSMSATTSADVDVVDEDGKSIVSPIVLNRVDPPLRSPTTSGRPIPAAPGASRAARALSRRHATLPDRPRPPSPSPRACLLARPPRPPTAPTPSCQVIDPQTGQCTIVVDPRRRSPGHDRDDVPKQTGGGSAVLLGPGAPGSVGVRRPGRCPARSEYGYWSNAYHCYITAGRTRSRPPATRTGRAMSRGTVRSTSATSRRQTSPIYIWAAGPAPGLRRRDDPRRGGADRGRPRWTSRRSTSASRPSPATTASAWSACRCGCGRPPRRAHLRPDYRVGLGWRHHGHRDRRGREGHLGDGRRRRGGVPPAGTPYKPELRHEAVA